MRTSTLLLLLALGACAAKTPKPNDAPSALNQEVALLDPGAEPRAEVLYHRTPGQSERVLLRLSVAHLLETQAGEGVSATPVVDLVLHLGSTYRGEGGAWGYPMRIEMIGVQGAEQLSEEQRARLSAELAPIGEVQGVFELDDRGITRKAQVTPPAGVSPRLLALLGNLRTGVLAAALPREPIGIGARWETDRIMHIGRMSVPQTVTYTLLARELDELRIGVTVRQSAKAQSFQMGLDDTTLNIESYELSAVGTLVMELHHLAPLSELRVLSQMRATLQRAGKLEPVAMSGEGAILIAPVPAGVGAAPGAEPARPHAGAAQPAAATGL
jgi:hypothetical protein